MPFTTYVQAFEEFITTAIVPPGLARQIQRAVLNHLHENTQTKASRRANLEEGPAPITPADLLAVNDGAGDIFEMDDNERELDLGDSFSIARPGAYLVPDPRVVPPGFSRDWYNPDAINQSIDYNQFIYLQNILPKLKEANRLKPFSIPRNKNNPNRYVNPLDCIDNEDQRLLIHDFINTLKEYFNTDPTIRLENIHTFKFFRATVFGVAGTGMYNKNLFSF